MIWQFDLIFYHDAIVAQNLFLLNFRLLLINMHIILSLHFYIILISEIKVRIHQSECNKIIDYARDN